MLFNLFYTVRWGKKQTKQERILTDWGELSFVAASLSAYHFIQNQNIYSWKKNLFYQQLYLRTLYAHGLSFCLKNLLQPPPNDFFSIFLKNENFWNATFLAYFPPFVS